jgi:hypothetical protein
MERYSKDWSVSRTNAEPLDVLERDLRQVGLDPSVVGRQQRTVSQVVLYADWSRVPSDVPETTRIIMSSLPRDIAITLFTLRPGRTVEQYRDFARDVIRPGMVRMPAVLGFLDYEVVGSLEDDDGIELVELIEITSPDDFNRDNEGPVGAPIAEQWLEWVTSFRVLFVRDLLLSST